MCVSVLTFGSCLNLEATCRASPHVRLKGLPAERRAIRSLFQVSVYTALPFTTCMHHRIDMVSSSCCVGHAVRLSMYLPSARFAQVARRRPFADGAGIAMTALGRLYELVRQSVWAIRWPTGWASDVMALHRLRHLATSPREVCALSASSTISVVAPHLGFLDLVAAPCHA